jgi:predicted signal transduction protein with EAL and GGDEF domain
MKKIATFTLAYFSITMAWAYPWHMVWFHDLYTSWGAMTRTHPIMPLGIAAILIQGIVIGYLYPFFNKGGNPIFQGIKFSLIIGLMVYTAMGFATAAKIQIEPVSEFLLYHTIFQTIQFILAGAALGWIFRR